jgi:hypothetical protein
VNDRWAYITRGGQLSTRVIAELAPKSVPVAGIYLRLFTILV